MKNFAVFILCFICFAGSVRAFEFRPRSDEIAAVTTEKTA